MASGQQVGSRRVQRFSLNTVGRDFAVGDIHGHFSRLDRVLTDVGFSPRCDRLFALGDMVDRGPESAAVLAWLQRPWFHAILGNHELMVWQRLMQPSPLAMDAGPDAQAWLDGCDAATRAKLGAALADLPLAAEVSTAAGLVGLVHAGFPYDDWLAIHRASFSDEDEAACLWSRERYVRRYVQPIRHIRAVIHGHTTVAQPTQLGNVYYLDTGGWKAEGKFTLLDLGSLTSRLL